MSYVNHVIVIVVEKLFNTSYSINMTIFKMGAILHYILQ